MQARHIQVLNMKLERCDQLQNTLHARDVPAFYRDSNQENTGSNGEKVRFSQGATTRVTLQENLSHMERLRQERNTVVLSRANPPPGAAALSAVVECFFTGRTE